MIIFYLLLTSFIYIIVKIILYILIFRYGKFSYDGFSAAGFSFNSEKSIFYSTRNAWQKKFGYCHFYDVAAPIFQMIIDTEPVRFSYNNKNYLLTFWKGQYGIVTGAEIGIYTNTNSFVFKNSLYMPNDEDMLDMGFTLYRNGKEVTNVNAKHWWLAIFKIGLFSNPKDLTMDIKLKFKNEEMLNAFLEAFKKIGYKENEYNIEDNIFYFTFKRPKTRKVWTRNILADSIRQKINKRNVKLYNKVLNDVIEDNKVDDTKTDKKRIIFQDFVPDILKNKEEIKLIEKPKETIKNIIYLDNKVYSNYGVINEK